MSLLIVYIALLAFCEVIAFGVGAIVDQYMPSMGILVFFPLYVAAFWIAWLISVRITRPKEAEAV